MTTFLLKVLYRIVARESVPLPLKRTAIAWHPSSSITAVVWFGRMNALAQDPKDRVTFQKFPESILFPNTENSRSRVTTCYCMDKQ